MVFGSEILTLTRDILRGVNATVWGGVEGAEKVGSAVKTGISGADVVIGTSHALEDFACNDIVCCAISAVGSVSSATGLVLGNIPTTKHLTVGTTAVTIGCRSIRCYCKKYGTFWGCTVAVGQAAREALKSTMK